MHRTNCDILLLTCIDFRFTDKTTTYMKNQGYAGNYDHAILPGASLGIAHPSYPHWQKTLGDILNVATECHGVSKLLVLDHEDCLAYRRVCGCDTNQESLKKRAPQIIQAKTWLKKIYPSLSIEFLFMKMDGSVMEG